MKKDFFWVSYSDLMTSLFFVMLVMFVVTTHVLKEQKRVTEAVLSEIKNVQTALESLDQNYFQFDSLNKRYKLNSDVLFKINSSNIGDLNPETHEFIENAGKNLYKTVENLILRNSKVEFLIVIEGSTARNSYNYIKLPNIGYELSYKRALALFNFWKESGLDFSNLGNQCEVIIAGSGYFGYSRAKDETMNKRFTIQVTSKVGKFLEQHNYE